MPRTSGKSSDPPLSDPAPVRTLAPMQLPDLTSPRRALCSTCLRPQATCICRWIAPVATRVSLLILQHPLEVQHAKGSGRLLHLCLPGSVLVAGEQFDPAALAALLHEGGRQPVLLYPGAADDPAVLATPPQGLRLVVLDATWRKSRKMLHLNPALAALPRLSLRAMPPSHYRIRKALEPDHAALAGLLDAFDGFVGQQAGYAANAGPPSN